MEIRQKQKVLSLLVIMYMVDKINDVSFFHIVSQTLGADTLNADAKTSHDGRDRGLQTEAETLRPSRGRGTWFKTEVEPTPRQAKRCLSHFQRIAVCLTNATCMNDIFFAIETVQIN